MMYRYRFPRWLLSQPRLTAPVVAIESDDWGYDSAATDTVLGHFPSVACSSRAAIWASDSRESPDDVRSFAEVLSEFRDAGGEHPVATLNWIVRQPDFAHIAAGGFRTYRTQPHSDKRSLEAAIACARGVGTIEFGLHGSEHLNPTIWLEQLRKGDRTLRAYFDAGVMPPPAVYESYPGLGAAYLDTMAGSDIAVSASVSRVAQAIDSFEQLFSQKPASFTPPNHCWNAGIEGELARGGVDFLQAAEYQYPNVSAYMCGSFTNGATFRPGRNGVALCGRTVRFEPRVDSTAMGRALVLAGCLIERRIPVIVSSHRVNYVTQNREIGLTALRGFLRSLLKRYPDVRFLSSAKLYRVYAGGQRRGIQLASSIQNLRGRWGGFASDCLSVSVRRDYFGTAGGAA